MILFDGKVGKTLSLD